MSFSQEVLSPALQSRRLLCQPIKDFHQQALIKINRNPLEKWSVHLGDALLFDYSGLQAIKQIIQTYHGSAKQLYFKLQLSEQAIRDYYSHSHYLGRDGLITLPIVASITIDPSEKELEIVAVDAFSDTLLITLEELSTPTHSPLSLAPPDINSTPLALLMPYSADHDFLFANQIAIFANLKRHLKSSPFSWIKALFLHRKISLKKRISLAWKQIHPSADIHPTAVIEGSIIGAGCRIGAYSVVRYSILGENIQLYDGAKVEFSVVDKNSSLMHDLVLYRCLVEEEVFLIHGPYQFSFFQRESAAFATIMMDYRPDNKPIRISTAKGVRDYQGRFLGALLEEQAKVFAGTLTAPGITIPKGRQITCSIENITTAKTLLK